MNNLSIEIINWHSDSDAVRAIREAVFINEQHVPIQDEWDKDDELAVHFLATWSQSEQALPVATARLLTDGQIGRVAVIKTYRQQGIGSQLLKAVIQFANQHRYPNLYLHAQIQTLDFYRQFGFECVGETFWEAGILHRQMELPRPTLTSSP